MGAGEGVRLVVAILRDVVRLLVSVGGLALWVWLLGAVWGLWVVDISGAISLGTASVSLDLTNRDRATVAE